MFWLFCRVLHFITTLRKIWFSHFRQVFITFALTAKFLAPWATLAFEQECGPLQLVRSFYLKGIVGWHTPRWMFSLCKSNEFVGKLGSFTGTWMTSNDQLDHCNYFIFTLGDIVLWSFRTHLQPSCLSRNVSCSLQWYVLMTSSATSQLSPSY